MENKASRDTKKTERFLKIAAKGGMSSVDLSILDFAHEIEDDLIKYKEDVAKETQAINEAIVAAGKNTPDLEKVLESVRGKQGKTGEVGEKGDSPTAEELVNLIVPLIPDPIVGEQGQQGIPGKDGKPGRDGRDGQSIVGEKGDKGDSGSPDAGDAIIQKINELPIEEELLIEKEHVEGLVDFENLTDQRIEAVRQVAAKIIHGPLGMQVFTGGTKHGWLKEVDFVGSGGVSLAYSEVNGKPTLTFSSSANTDINFVDNETPSGVFDGVNTTYTLAHAPSPAASLELYLNSVLQIQGVDYTLSGTTITYTTAQPSQFSGLPHKAFYRYGTVSGATAFTQTQATITGQTTPVTLTASQSGSMVYFDDTNGMQVNLPAPTVGVWYEFFFEVNIVANDFRIVTDALTTFLIGNIINMNGSAFNVYSGNGTSNRGVAFSNGGEGAQKGSKLKVTCVSATLWLIEGAVTSSGSPATPFVI